MDQFSSRALQQAVDEFAHLPGIGRKTALRLVLHLLKQEAATVERFGACLQQLHQEIQYCRTCHNLTDKEECDICRSPRRDPELICVVEDIRDVMAIEKTGQFNGLYHVLGGIISPMEGLGPADLNIESLERRLRGNPKIKEAILALSTTMEGDTTSFYLYRLLKPFGIQISAIARGIAVGDELEYADEVTLGRSIVNRTAYETSPK